MALQIEETWASGDGTAGSSTTEEVVYIVGGDVADGADKRAIVTAWALTQIPSTIGLLPRTDVKRSRLNDTNWVFTATYGLPAANALQAGQQSFSFNTAGGTQHITRALQHVKTWYLRDDGVLATGDAASQVSPQDGFINPSLFGGDVQGADIETGAFSFTITTYIAVTNMTAAYLNLLKSCTYTTNAIAGTFYVEGVPFSFDEGEALYCGCTGGIRSADKVFELTHSFKAGQNKEGLTFGSITGVDKKAWEYISVVTKTVEKKTGSGDSATVFIGPEVRLVLVDQVFPSENWVGLIPAAA